MPVSGCNLPQPGDLLRRADDDGHVARQGVARPEAHLLDQLPDLTVLWEQSFPWESLYSPRVGALRLRLQDARSGAHTAHGFVLAMGPGVPAGAEAAAGSIYHIAPTVLDRAGVPIPPDFDGVPLLSSSMMKSGG